ncbi:glycoside hydrolase family 3 C-terminal domain-containing protein [Olivibacter sp. SDN3]|uniref:glycoside hydrolase family 3 C-terminal domain-containing protein n=1 Tax=Olivibacter sp. SDN3 TaxID=2764720 RepID=UPI0021072C9D|nr:glycoside hydrolase family 3 C-terminal domain-containing protein [Olivibacter sp. SDN3]
MDDFFKNHKTHASAADAAADAVYHGTDLDCGTDAYKALVQAVKEGKITEESIDTSVKRLFMIRFRLGMFDPVSMVKYAQTPDSILESSIHGKHALEMARSSAVLLKNEQHTLPLRKNLKKVVVLGPNADNAIAILGNYNGIPSKLSTVLDGIRQKVGAATEIIYEQAINFTNDTLLTYAEMEGKYTFNGRPGVHARYFSNTAMKGDPIFERYENTIDHFWQEGETIADGLRANDFSVHFQTDFHADHDSPLVFEVEADDGYRLIVNDDTVLNAWERNRWGAKTYTLNTKRDSVYHLELEYWQGGGKGNIRLSAGNFQRTDFKQLAEQHKDTDAFIFVGGISPQLEGEEMQVDYPGFNGGDRTSILLPTVQTALMKELQATGKPVVFVMMTGSAIAIPWEADHLPAILNAWYGGQAAGTAVADILFGDYNPSGRLPVTFYRGDEDLVAFNDYNMDNRTYRYFKGKPLYGFGYGLSYTSFKYEDVQLPKKLKKGESVQVKTRVRNVGDRDGDEVVQLYIVNSKGRDKMPLKSLKGFRRIHLKAGEAKELTFELSPKALSYVQDDGSSALLEGEVEIAIGGVQPGEQNDVKNTDLQRRTVYIN